MPPLELPVIMLTLFTSLITGKESTARETDGKYYYMQYRFPYYSQRNVSASAGQRLRYSARRHGKRREFAQFFRLLLRRCPGQYAFFEDR